MAGRRPEERVPVPMARQDWRTMTFLHWRFDPEVVQALLPEDLRVHTRDDTAWVSLTPFVLARFRPPIGPSVPRLSTFPETNLRTYVLGPDGRDGLWFLDIEVASAITATALRATLDLPYRVADMEVDEHPPVHYRSARSVASGRVGYDIVVAPGAPLDEDDDSLDHWLAGRWRAFSRPAGLLLATPVRHEPWPLHTADLVSCEENLLEHVGLPAPEEPPLVRFSPGVSVDLGPPDPSRVRAPRSAT